MNAGGTWQAEGVTDAPLGGDQDLARLKLLRRAKDAMDRDWAQRLDLNAVAAIAGYSPYHFIRLFKQAYGESPGRYLSRRRVERAQDLLHSANLTVSEVCTAVGFESLGSFCTRFKQFTGRTPTEFRNAALRGGPAAVPGCFVLLWAGGFDDGDANLEKPAAPARS
ncbi:MAG TPA: AraC family transcriptional regulator [Actinocrinis sp.]|nr:AraC family transcriptional regulator [Actinocrinis sp.]HZP55056.1 AraC family transcriptional regulator [Actinocrinis sp.]